MREGDERSRAGDSPLSRRRPAGGFPAAVIPHEAVDVKTLYGDRAVLPFGRAEDGRLAGWQLSHTDAPNALIVGVTGTGMTALLVLLAVEAARQGIEVWGCDPNVMGFSGLRGWPNVKKIATGSARMVRLVEEFRAEMLRRHELIEAGRAHTGDFGRAMLIIDGYELFTMLTAGWWQHRPGPTPEARKLNPVTGLIRQIAVLSRGAGTHLAIGAVRPGTWSGAYVLDTFGLRVAHGLITRETAQILWEDPGIGAGLPYAEPGLGTATTPDGPRHIKVHRVPSPAAAAGHLTGGDLALLWALLPAGATWDAFAHPRGEVTP
jgi:hypothetical protein